MNRRSFLASLTAAIAAPQVLIASASDAFHWKKTAEGIWVLNPEWRNAPYEIVIARNPVAGGGYQLHWQYRSNAMREGFVLTLDTYPLRYSEYTCDYGKAIAPFIPKFPKRRSLFS